MPSLDNLLSLLAAVLLEKSLVCHGQDLNKVSSVILGLESLIRPFKWTMALVPILPEILIDTVEAPVPLLVGISHKEYKTVIKQLSKDEMSDKVWVNADTGDVSWCKDFPALFSFGKLKETMSRDWKFI